MGVSARNRNESDKEKENEACPNRNTYQRTTPATSFGTSEPSYQDLFVAFISTCTLLTAPTSS